MTGRPAGVIAPLVTPLDADGVVSRDGIRNQIEVIRPWVCGLMPGIGCGEGWRLTASQWRVLTQETIRRAGGLPVYAGCQATDWAQLEQRAAWAEDMGADAVVVSIPARHGEPPPDALVARFRQLRTLIRGPVVYYWESFISGYHVRAELGVQICRELRAIAVKDSMRSPELTSELLDRLRGVTSVLQGWEDMLSPDLATDGYVGPLALLSDSVTTVFSGRPQWRRILRESERYGVLERDYVVRVKAELHRRGVIPSPAVLPEPEPAGVRSVGHHA